MEIVVRAFFIGLILAVWPVALHAQEDRIVVKVSVEEPGYGESSLGGGVLFAITGNTAQIVTAAHVVTGEDSGSAHNLDDYSSDRALINITFRSGDTVRGRVRHIDEAYLSSYGDAGTDLAILEAPVTSSIKAMFEESRSVLADEGVDLLIEDGVTSIGFSGGVMWSMQRRRSPVMGFSGPSDRDICFAPGTISQGQSGGALFDEFGALRGLVLRISPFCKASSGVSQRVAKALSWSVIDDYLKTRGYRPTLSRNDTFLPTIAAAVLRDERLDSNSDIEAALLNSKISLETLSLYPISKYDVRRFEELLSRPVSASGRPFYDEWVRHMQTSNCRIIPARTIRITQIAAAAGQGDVRTCNQGLASWFGDMIDMGVDPNHIIARPRTPTHEDGSLLSGAFRGGATDLTLALLDAGAYPNPYFDLAGRTGWKNSFVDPLWAVPRLFKDVDQDRVFDALKKAGVVVFRDEAGVRAGEFKRSKTLRETKTDPVCVNASKRDEFDWCARVRQTETVSFKSGVITKWSGAQGEHRAILSHTLFITPNHAYVLAWLPGPNIKNAEAIVLKLSRESRDWSAYWHDNNYRCRKRADGTAPKICWREFKAEPVALRVKVPPLFSTSSSDSQSAQLSPWRLETIGLDTRTGQAIDTLVANGFKANRKGNYRDAPGRLLTQPYQKEVRGRFTILTLYTIDETVFMIERMSQQTFLFDQFDQIARQAGDAVEVSVWQQNGLRATFANKAARIKTETQEIGLALKARGNSKGLSRETSLLFRRPVSGAEEIALRIDRRLKDEFPPMRPAKGKRGCIDNYILLRSDATGCLSLPDYEDAFLKRNGKRKGVKTLANGVQYEITSRLSDTPFLPDRSYYGLYTHGVLDDLGESVSRGGRSYKIGEAYPRALNDVLSQLNEGDDVKIYIPSEVRRETDDIDLLATSIYTIRFSGKHGIFP